MAFDIEKPYNWVSKIIRDNEKKMKEIYTSPRVIEQDREFIPKLMEMFDLFIDDFRCSDISSVYIAVLKEYKEILINSINDYIKGNIKQALDKIHKILYELRENDKSGIAFSTIHESISFNPTEKILNKSVIDRPIEFYRARNMGGNIKYGREEMLHIPFDSREKVASERFSIPGMPCLYLGTSSYCCWIETGCPSDDCFNVSPVCLNENDKILNLSINSSHFEYAVNKYSNVKEPNDNLITLFKLWLLSAVTSFRVNQEKRSFKSEYILPQLVMLVTKEMGYDGVAYLSKRVKDDRFAEIIAVNLALFEEYNGERKLSTKCEDVRIAPSVNYAMYKNLTPSATYKADSTELHMKTCGYFLHIGDIERYNEYTNTMFYRFDQYLFSEHISNEIQCIDIKSYNDM